MIRRADRRDVEAIVAVFEPSFATLDFLATLHTHDEHVAFFGRRVAEGEAWVWGDDRIRGFAILQEHELTHLYVAPDSLGRGIGSALLDKTKERLPEGFTLWVFQANGRARRFHEHRGMQCIRLTDGRGNEERSPDALYEWRPTP